MDDSCAVCAESLEWVAYGACGHKDVCSTCVARLRFICNDTHCCICKTETAIVFVTKSLGDYTKTIGDFSLLPSEVKEGRVGQYWYHEDTQALFDDSDHYKMIKAMCRLSCSECDKMEGHPEDGSKKRARYKNIDQLKGHLFHKHKLLVCSLCLEGRKVFVCEQKLYTRSQLTQHINTGDSEVDGTESERGGFSGHPMCEFCRTPFYGDNELYTHMSTEHYTCHICQRQHPGQYEYYKNYDDLEIHFRRGHFLCEDDGCLAKKFIVFQSEAELKRHNALEHGGRMSRSQRSVALQIPTSFRYRSSEQQNRRGRGLTFRRDPHDNELSLAIQASLETAPSRNRDNGERFDVDSLISPLESIELQSRYRQAVSQSSMSGTIGDSAFPPLAVGSRSNQQSSQTNSVSKKTSKKEVKSTSSAPSWPAVSRTQPVVTKKKVNASSSAPHDWSAFNPKPVIASRDWPGVNTISGSALNQPSVSTTSFVGSLRTSGRTNRLSYSSSAPSLSFEASSSTDFPPVSSAALPLKSTTDLGKAKDVHTANKSLLEKMRAALGYDEDKFTAFRDISGEYRHGTIDVETYLVYVDQFGLSHLVHELARLLPNGQKQKELIEVYNLHMAYAASIENGSSNDIKSNGRGKGKCLDSGNSTNKNSLVDHVISSVAELPEEEVEVLRKNGYRSAMGKSKVRVGDSPLESSEVKNQIQSLPAGGGSNQNAGNGSGKGKLRKKTSKFYRVRLGDGSVEALLDLRNGDRYPDTDPGEALSSVPARSVWRNGGGHKLFSTKK